VHATSLMLGKLSGRHAFKDKLESMGYVLEDTVFEDAFRRFKDLADKKKHVFDDDIAALVDDGIMRGKDTISIKALRVEAGTGIVPVASLTLEAEGAIKSVTVSGDGPVDAIFMAIREAYPHNAALQLFQINAVTEGTDAQATVTVRLEENGRTVTGKASDTDTMVAAAYAYVNALNKLLVKREKHAPEALTVAR
jgi:2-isopropylmalate synthase